MKGVEESERGRVREGVRERQKPCEQRVEMPFEPIEELALHKLN